MFDKNNLPRVLVVGINAWREDGTAHTLMDIFRCWDPDKVALIYTRADLPNTHVANRFFQISESQVLRSVVRPWMKVGNEVESTVFTNQSDAQSEHKRYAQAHKRHSAILPLAREVVWRLGHWKTNALREFIKDFNPDLLFIPIYPTVYMGWLQKYIIHLTDKPYVSYLADDNYSYDSCQGLLSHIHRFWLRQQVGPIARGSKEMFVIVEKEKEDTDQRFFTDSVILTKSIDFTDKTFTPHSLNHPLRFVYTGSLIIGRDRSLTLLADAINEINDDSVKTELYIYSQTEPSNKSMRHLNNGASHFCGRIGREEVQRVQQEADVVVFAEALEGKEAYTAKLSFSTKITDYLSNGKCILAIGKSDIAPIDYFRRNDSAIIAHNSEEIIQCVKRLTTTPTLITEYSRKAYDCAVRNHGQSMMRERFISTMLKAINIVKA